MLWGRWPATALGAAVTGALLHRPGPVEEVGAGTGLITHAIGSTGRPVTAHEPAAAMRRRLEKRCPEATVTDKVLMDLADDGRPRDIVAVNVLHLLDDPDAALAHLRRCAGAAGRVVLVVPSPDATMATLLRGLAEVGAPLWFRARFVALHLVVAPVAPVLSSRPGRRWARGQATMATGQPTAIGTFQVVVIDGDGDRDSSGPGRAGPQ